MHSIRRATLKAASAHGSRAVVAAPRLAWAPKAAAFNVLPSMAVAFSRSFVATRWLAEQLDSSGKDVAAMGDEAPVSTPAIDSTAAPEKARQQSQFAKGEDTPYGLFIRNLVFDANEEHLMDAFGKYGEITKASVARDARGLSRGYAFVFFTNAEDMNKAAVGANGSFWHGRRIHASPRLKPGKFEGGEKRDRVPLAEKQPTNSLYVGNIPYETTDAELNKLFRSLDNVTDVRIAVDRSTGWPRGFAHADFSSVEAAMQAALKLESMTLLGRQLRIDYSQAKRPNWPRETIDDKSSKSQPGEGEESL